MELLVLAGLLAAFGTARLVTALRFRKGGADLAAAEALRAESQRPAIVVLTTFDTDEHIRRALRLGANGFLLKGHATDREREVAVAIGAGRSNAEIGVDLYMSTATVKAYVSRILAKLQCANRVQVAILVHEARG